MFFCASFEYIILRETLGSCLRGMKVERLPVTLAEKSCENQLLLPTDMRRNIIKWSEHLVRRVDCCWLLVELDWLVFLLSIIVGWLLIICVVFVITKICRNKILMHIMSLRSYIDRTILLIILVLILVPSKYSAPRIKNKTSRIIFGISIYKTSRIRIKTLRIDLGISVCYKMPRENTRGYTY